MGARLVADPKYHFNFLNNNVQKVEFFILSMKINKKKLPKTIMEIYLKIPLFTTLWWEPGGRSYQEVSATTVGALHINLAKDH